MPLASLRRFAPGTQAFVVLGSGADRFVGEMPLASLWPMLLASLRRFAPGTQGLVVLGSGADRFVGEMPLASWPPESKLRQTRFVLRLERCAALALSYINLALQ